MRKPTRFLIAACAATALLAAGCSDDDDSVASTGTTVAESTATTMADDMAADDAADDDAMAGDIVATATAAGDFTVLLEAATAAGLVDELQGPGPLTVFAPTDEAFAAALESLGTTKEELFADTDALAQILLYHVVEGEVLAADVVELDGQSATTLNGAAVDISVVDGSVFLNEDTEVVTTDVMASNGVIHVIDGVLLPPA